VLAAGAARCWGINNVGQLGNGTKSASNVPVPVTGVTVDVIAPTVTAPIARPKVGAKLSGTSEPLVISWTAIDSGGSGIARYTLQTTADSGGHWTTLSTALTTNSLTWIAPTGGTVGFRVRATDKLGNTSSWAAASDLAPRLWQQTNASTVFAGAWHSQSLSSFSGGSVRYATTAGARATITTPTTTTSVALVATKSPNRGKVSVYVDGTRVAIIDCHAATTAYRIVIWQATWGTPGAHVIKFIVAGTSGRPRVDVDALAVTTSP